MKGILKQATDQAKAKRLTWIKAQRKKGVHPTKIAEKLGVTRQRVLQIMQEGGVE